MISIAKWQWENVVGLLGLLPQLHSNSQVDAWKWQEYQKANGSRELRQDFAARHSSLMVREKTDIQEEDPFIAEARRLVGDDLLEIKK